jgi:hypothetical protein
MIRQYLPIRKVLVGGLAAGLVYLARKNGISLGDAQADDLVNVFVAPVFAWAVHDPRVREVERTSLSLLGKVRVLLALAEATANAPAAPAEVKGPIAGGPVA